MIEPRVGRVAYALGFAGLLPQVAAVAALVLVWSRRDFAGDLMAGVAGAAALVYGAVILSFLGGIWWGHAMRRRENQALLAVVAVVPSLVGAGAVLAALPSSEDRIALIVLGAAIMATLPVDRHLVATGEAPVGWMALRVPLSLGLGVLTIAAGLLSRS